MLSRLFPNAFVRLYIGMFFIFTPISCFIKGKQESVIVYCNKSVPTIKTDATQMNTITVSTDSLKSLGFLGDKFIISSLDNKRIFILNQSILNVVELKTK